MPYGLSRYSFDLDNPEAARAMAQEIADKAGREIVVTDKDGIEVWRVRPIRRNELMALPRTLN
jgi:hypothetical protein